VTPQRTAWDAGYVLVGAAVAATSAWPIYESPRVALVAAVAAAAGIAIALLGARGHWPFWRALALAAGAFVVLVVPLAVPAGLGSPERFARALRDGVFGVVLGWKQLLTLSLPLGQYQAVLVPLLVVILFGTAIALSLILRFPRRAALAIVVVAAMTVFGAAFGPSATGAPLRVGPVLLPAAREVLLGILLVVASLVWLVGRARLERTESLRVARASSGALSQGPRSLRGTARRGALAAGMLALALVGGLALAPVTAALVPRQALRDTAQPLVVLREQSSPLSGYRAWFAGDAYDAELFTVSGAGEVDRLRIATLDSYDGEVFEVGDGARFTRLPRASADGDSITVTIGDGYRGPWVPVPAGLSTAPVFQGERADPLADGFYLGESDATALDTAPAGTGAYGLRAGDRYRVSAGATAGESLVGATGGRSLLPVESHPALVAWVDQQEVPRSGEGLLELVSRLAARGYLSHSLTDDDGARGWIAGLAARAPYTFLPSYAGHGSARVDELFAALSDQQRLAGPGVADDLLVAAVGDDEQFATAAALLARHLGFDSRVVVGVRLTAPAGSSVAPCRDGVCTGATVTAWAEARTPSGTWVPLDASPQFTVPPTTITVGEQLPENPTAPDQVTTDVVTPPVAQRDDTPAADAPPAPAPGWLEALLPVLARIGMGLLGVALLLLPAIVLVAAKALRRRGRRRAREPEVRIVGAWDELVDAYTDSGASIPRHVTRGAVAALVGRAAAVDLADVVDRAVFAENPPGAVLADRAWALVDGERRELRRASTRIERMRAALRPASPSALLGREDTA